MITAGHERVLELAYHESGFPQRFAGTLLEGLRARRLPGAWLYHYPAQAALWLAYHDAWSPSRTEPALAELYRRAGAAALAEMPGGALDVVSLGCGGGRKDADLLALALKARAEPPWPRYVPVDAAPALVLEAVLHVARRFPHLPFCPLVADLAAAPDLGGWLDALGPRAPRLLACYGMVPNLEADGLLAFLARLLAPGDALLVSANLSPGGLAADRAAILPQYDNPQARRWYMAALEALGLAAVDVALTVAALPLENGGEAAWQVVVEAGLLRDAAAEVFGERVPLAAGERLRVFASARFTVPAFEARLEAAGLVPRERWINASGEEGILLCAAPAAGG